MKITNMKKYFLLICLFAIALSSCRKIVDDTAFDATAQAVRDDQAIHDYFLLRGITPPIKDASGLYYEVTNPGTGTHPTVASNITVGYSAYSLDDVLVDSSPSAYFAPLDGLINAWRIGIPKIGKGGSITLYAPSGLAYGNAANGVNPPNTVLIFKITLQGFNN
ncbi:MAG: FKBP-type peptidyl-prolyl cis-trans isomerase [Mucilaginibacter sp.]|nr:FKBP-type peptidyl-prolyl cis-trans isomerase [Mucilaginibacter sp.]